MYVINCANYYVYGSGGVPTSHRGVAGGYGRAWARIEMTPARITPARVFLYPRLAARGERVARDARVVCALRVCCA